MVNKDEIRKGKRVMDTLTGNVGILVDIQEVHDRYQLDNVSGWQYGIKNLVPFDAKEETIRQQAEEIERLQKNIGQRSDSYDQLDQRLQRIDKARLDAVAENVRLLQRLQATERERDEQERLKREAYRNIADWQEALRVSEERNTALRECLDKHRVFAAHIATRAERDVSRFEGDEHVIGSQMYVSVADAKEMLSQARTLLDRKDTQPLCQDCRRGMVYCGECNESEYDRYHGLEDTQPKDGAE